MNGVTKNDGDDDDDAVSHRGREMSESLVSEFSRLLRTGAHKLCRMM